MIGLPKLVRNLALGCGFWLIDSLLYCFIHGIRFSAALWSAVPGPRLLVRLFVLLIFLMVGVMRYIGNVVRRREIIRMNKADNGALYGNSDSSRKSQRILYHAMRLATMLKMRPREKERLRLLCYCYDIGMVGVPNEILEKEQLNKAEQAKRDFHTDMGAEICRQIPQLAAVAPLVLTHEECYDGSGIHGQYGRAIPLACRIFAVCMLFDFFTQPHVGSRILDTAEALDELQLYRGNILDPDVLDAFIRLMKDNKLAYRIGEIVYAPN